MARTVTFHAITSTGPERPIGRQVLADGETAHLAAEAHTKLAVTRAAEDTARRRTVRDTVAVRADLLDGTTLVDSDTAYA